MVFEKYSKNLTRDFDTLDKGPEQKKIIWQKVKVLINGIKMEDTKLIAYKSTISQNYASDFTETCSHLFIQVTRLHGGAQLKAKMYK